MSQKVNIVITGYEFNNTTDVHTLTFTREDEVAEALELTPEEVTSIEVPSHAPPPQP